MTAEEVMETGMLVNACRLARDPTMEPKWFPEISNIFRISETHVNCLFLYHEQRVSLEMLYVEMMQVPRLAKFWSNHWDSWISVRAFTNKKVSHEKLREAAFGTLFPQPVESGSILSDADTLAVYTMFLRAAHPELKDKSVVSVTVLETREHAKLQTQFGLIEIEEENQSKRRKIEKTVSNGEHYTRGFSGLLPLCGANDFIDIMIDANHTFLISGNDQQRLARIELKTDAGMYKSLDEAKKDPLLRLQIGRELARWGFGSQRHPNRWSDVLEDEAARVIASCCMAPKILKNASVGRKLRGKFERDICLRRLACTHVGPQEQVAWIVYPSFVQKPKDVSAKLVEMMDACGRASSLDEYKVHMPALFGDTLHRAQTVSVFDELLQAASYAVEQNIRQFKYLLLAVRVKSTFFSKELDDRTRAEAEQQKTTKNAIAEAKLDYPDRVTKALTYSGKRCISSDPEKIRVMKKEMNESTARMDELLKTQRMLTQSGGVRVDPSRFSPTDLLWGLQFHKFVRVDL
uniref:Uncharacterized protein n=1 Tax=Prymnesium polylepis TaxID=72548 RepID=A0A7S4HC30_9EUKA